jgi:hypothetical protein
MALVQRDFILRMIEAIAAAVARIVKRKQSGDLAGARKEVHDAVTELLGPASAMVGMLDSRTAANVVSDPKRIALWARLLSEDADVLRLMGRTKEAEATDRRTLELLLESWRREELFDDDTQRHYEEVRTRVPLEQLDAGFRAVAADLESRGEPR